MSESITPNPNNDVPKPREIIEPLQGLEDKTYSLPEPDENGSASDVHHDDWLIVGEQADENGNLTIDLSRYRDDESVETRAGIPVDVFEAYQVKIDAERRFRDAKEQTLGASAVRMQLVDMVRKVRGGEDKAELRDAEAGVLADIRERLAKERKASLQRLEEYNKSKRRENPVKYLFRGRHHPKPFPDDPNQGEK